MTGRFTTVDVQGLAGDKCAADLGTMRRWIRGQRAVGTLTGGLALARSEITVKAHRGQVMRKMQVQSLADLVRVAGALDVRLVAHV